LRIDWVPIGYLFRTSERSVSAQSAQFGVEIKTLSATEGLQAAIDYDRFRQILSNLLANALKCTPAGGRIDLIAERTAQDGIALTVRDNGIGIPAADLPRILEGSVNGAVHGAGLGLPIALQLVEAHGGTLHIESVLGEGTAVIITLPPGSARLVG
jgi:signal transduction histidine kinase